MCRNGDTPILLRDSCELHSSWSWLNHDCSVILQDPCCDFELLSLFPRASCINNRKHFLKLSYMGIDLQEQCKRSWLDWLVTSALR